MNEIILLSENLGAVERACSRGYLVYNKICESNIKTQLLYSVFCVNKKCG